MFSFPPQREEHIFLEYLQNACFFFFYKFYIKIHMEVDIFRLCG